MEKFKLPIKVENVTISSEVYEALCTSHVQFTAMNANLLKFLEALDKQGVKLVGKDKIFVNGFDELKVQSDFRGNFNIDVR